MNRVEWNYDISCDGHCFTLPETNMSLESWWLEDHRFILRNGPCLGGHSLVYHSTSRLSTSTLRPKWKWKDWAIWETKKHSIFLNHNFLILEIWIMSYPHEIKHQIGISATKIFQPFQFTPFFWGEKTNLSTNGFSCCIRPPTASL